MQLRIFGLVKVLFPLGEPHTQYAGLLVRAGPVDQDAMQMLRKALTELAGIDLMVVRYVPQGSPLAMLLGNVSEVATLQNQAAQLDLSIFSDATGFVSSMTARRRQAKRRAVAALIDEGELQLKVLWPADPDFAVAVRQGLKWKENWIGQTGRLSSGFTFAKHDEFLASIPGDPEHGGAVVFALYAGARPIAYQIGFINKQQYHLYTASFDWGLRRWSLGTVLIDLTIGWLISNGINNFDLMGNPAPYKENWTNQPLQLSGHIISLSRLGALHGELWSKRLRPLVKAAYYMIPQSIRCRLARIQPNP